jgi:N-acetylmuramoyl-L-alanine amidase
MIFISAGHYPAHPGATHERFIEHDEAVVWRNLLIDKLIPLEVMSVPSEVLRSKVDFINARLQNGDLALEIHFNSALDKEGNHVGRGCETLYYPGSKKGKEFAEACQIALAEVFPPDRGVKEGWYRMDPTRGADFFLEKTKCPAVIIEPEFVHHSNIIQDNREEACENLSIIIRDLI